MNGHVIAPSSTPAVAVLPHFPAAASLVEEDDDGKGTLDQDLHQRQIDTAVRPSHSHAAAVPTWFIIIAWIALSTSVIFYNRKIMVEDHFPFPVTLTTVHLLFQTIVTRLLHRFTNLVAGPSPAASSYQLLPLNDPSSSQPGLPSDDARNASASVAMSWHDWRRKILPIALLTSASLVLSNAAYLFISTAFIHMLKSFAPVAILLAAFALGTKQPTTRLVAVILVITAGTALATHGEIHFDLVGFSVQSIAIAVEATRVTLIQILLQGDDMSPLRSLYHFAPVCLAFNTLLIIPLEGTRPFVTLFHLSPSGTTSGPMTTTTDVGPLTLVSNAALTFLLTISSTYLIGISAIVLSLSKVIKDVLIVLASALVVGDALTREQAFGYGVATVGLVAYKTLKL